VEVRSHTRAEGHGSLINIGLRCILFLVRESIRFIISIVPIDRNSLPKDPEILQQMLVDLTAQLGQDSTAVSAGARRQKRHAQ
jgi:hypothetical protein